MSSPYVFPGTTNGLDVRVVLDLQSRKRYHFKEPQNHYLGGKPPLAPQQTLRPNLSNTMDFSKFNSTSGTYQFNLALQNSVSSTNPLYNKGFTLNEDKFGPLPNGDRNDEYRNRFFPPSNNSSTSLGASNYMN